MDGDARGFRVALVAGELVNPGADDVDALTVLEQEGWGVIQLPAPDYPDEVAAPLLEQAAEQAEEFARHGYRLALVGQHDRLAAALDRYGLELPPAVVPESADQLRAFLATTATAERTPP